MKKEWKKRVHAWQVKRKSRGTVGKNQAVLRYWIIHFSTSSRVSGVSERMSGRASGLALTPRFSAVLNHCAMNDAKGFREEAETTSEDLFYNCDEVRYFWRGSRPYRIGHPVRLIFDRFPSRSTRSLNLIKEHLNQALNDPDENSFHGTLTWKNLYRLNPGPWTDWTMNKSDRV